MNSTLGRNRGNGESGFSLIEVVIALGLLAGVVITVSGLFILGGRQLKSGRTSSEALAVAREIVEEMNTWGFRQTWQIWDGSFTGAANTYTADTRTNTTPQAQEWQQTLEDKLGSAAFATVAVNSLAQTGTPPNFNTSSCKALRVVVTVFWNEGQRARTVQVGTVRM
jgi:uncharacterized protein (TIGR02598 family)